MRLGQAILALTFSVSVSEAQFPVSNLSRLGDYESRRTSSYDRSGGNRDYENLKAGGQLVLFDEAGPAEIRHIWITMASPEAYHLKKIVLRMYWDGETSPSVEAPIGDFFGLGLGTYTVFQSSLIVVAPEKALNAYFPMPFQHRGKITVTNEGSQDASDFYWNIDWVKLPAASLGHRLFSRAIPAVHALQQAGIRETSTAMISPKRIKIRAGTTFQAMATMSFWRPRATGNLSGVTLSVFQNQWGGWNEGDEMIWIDGENEPRIHGTGGEDYFNGAWGFSDALLVSSGGLDRVPRMGAGGEILTLPLAPGSAGPLSQVDPSHN